MLNYSGTMALKNGANKVIELINKYLNDYDKDKINKINGKRSCKISESDFYIAGGAIKSVLYDQEPNDYDVYFRNIEIAKVVLEAIVRVESKFINRDKGKTIKAHDSNTEIKDNDIDELKRSEKVIHKLIHMGMDLAMEFCDDEYNYLIPKLDSESVDDKLENMSRLYGVELDKKDLPTFYSSCVVTFGGHNIQLIFGVVNDDPIKLVENFDFKHTQIVYCPSSLSIIPYDNDVYISLLTKELYYTRKSKFPVSSLSRQRKYIKDGFKSNYKNDIKLAVAISKLDLDDPITFYVQATGMDVVFINKLFSDNILDQESFLNNLDMLMGDELIKGE